MKRSIKGGGGAPACPRTAQHNNTNTNTPFAVATPRVYVTVQLRRSRRPTATRGRCRRRTFQPPPGPSAPSQPRRSPPSSHLRCTEHGDGAAPTATIPALPALPALLSKADKQSGLLSLGCPYGACRRSVRRSRFAQSAGSGHVGWRLGGYAALARVHLSCFQRRSSEPWNNSLRMENRERCLKEMC